MPIILPITLCACAAAAILNFWLAWRVGQLRGKHKVLHGDDGGGPLTRRMRAQLNFVENTPFVLVLIAAIELTGKGDPWLAWVAAIYMLGRVAHGFGMDGEGATKFIEIRVSGAQSDDSAHRVAMSIANSPLVKTAIAGQDANWGRVVMAVGKAGEPADRDRLSIRFGGVEVAREGRAVEDFDEAPVAQHLKGEEIVVEADLGIGSGRARVYTCDLTHGYISINADYRS